VFDRPERDRSYLIDHMRNFLAFWDDEPDGQAHGDHMDADRASAVMQWMARGVGRTKVALCKHARVDRSDFYKWLERKKWPDNSAIDDRLRRELMK
jgi:hypothetical protein